MPFYIDRYFITLYFAFWIGIIAVTLISFVLWSSSATMSMIESVGPSFGIGKRIEKAVNYPDRKGAFAKQDLFENPVLNIPETSNR